MKLWSRTCCARTIAGIALVVMDVYGDLAAKISRPHCEWHESNPANLMIGVPVAGEWPYTTAEFPLTDVKPRERCDETAFLILVGSMALKRRLRCQ